MLTVQHFSHTEESMFHKKSVNAQPRSKRAVIFRVVAFSKVRGVIYFVITTKIFNNSKLLIIIYRLLENDSLLNGILGICSASNIMRCFFFFFFFFFFVKKCC